jgi:hypothetical protein
MSLGPRWPWSGMPWLQNCRLNPLPALAIAFVLVCGAYAPAGAAEAHTAAGQMQSATRPPAHEAYREVLSWASGKTKDSTLDAMYDRIERAAYRYSIIPEFALAVIAAEARYGKGISFARYDSWRMYEVTTSTKLQRYPAVLDDLDTALSELRLIMSNSNRVDDVFRDYWCGADGKFNADSLKSFSEAASKLWNGLEPYARERIRSEDRNKYTPEYYNKKAEQGDPAWAGLADGDMEGYKSMLGSMPLLAKQLKAYPDDERSYMRVAQSYNKNLSDAEALVIVRAILTYCEKTGWLVDPRLVMALVAAESSFKPKAVSKVGAMGLGQLMPATARGFGIRNAFDPIQNLYVTVKYLEREMYRWRGSANKTDLALAAYNAGPGAVQRYGGVPPYKETQNYVKIVRRNYAKFIPKKKG